MKNKKYWMVSLFLIAFILNPYALAWAESHIKNISLQREGDYTYITIFADAPFQLSHFIEEKKGEMPYRIVIDCMDAIHSLPQNNFRALPSKTISSIRTSQYQSSPRKICRVVLDLKESVVYKVVEQGDNRIAKLALSTPQESVFPQWSAVQEKEVEKFPKLAEAKPVEKAVLSEKPKNKIIASKEETIEKAKKDLTASAEKEIKLAQKPETTVPQKEVKSSDESISQTKKQEKVKSAEQSDQQSERKIPESTSAPEPPAEAKEVPVKITGKKMEEVPKRKILVYHSGKRKDPFSPLTGKKSFTLGTVPLPSIEELKLVGILEDNNGFKALLENELGFGYILQPGDKIRNGAVVSIDKERIIFQIWEYGYTKNIALELFTPNQEER